tara:strand:+ start:1337 stop:2167 length:831 start_codon:yes stop_codon:yes gene_type:complete
MKNIKLSCPAKLNLNLSIIKKRIDGMHDIESQFQLINLFDEMCIKKSNSKSNNIKTNIKDLIDDEKNIVFEAINELSRYVGTKIYCDIKITKNIPIGGGLGGGSSNAAGALIGINYLFELGLSSKELRTIGKNLGADVPFFVFGKNAWASGIGDNLIEDKNFSKKKYLLLFPQIHSSTKELFFEWDKLDINSQKKIQQNEENSFLPLFLEKNKDLKKVIQNLAKRIPLRLSGTGSTMFCEYDDPMEIEKTLKKVPCKWRHSFCEPLQCSPLLTYLK